MNELLENLFRDEWVKQSPPRSKGRLMRDQFCPDAILALAQRNPVVQMCLCDWRLGNLRWDEALALAVVHLAAQNEQLLECGARMAALAPAALTRETLDGSQPQTP